MPTEIPVERLYDAAAEAVARHGYAGATTRRIAELAGVAEVTLFRRFGTKDALLEEALTDAAEEFVEIGVRDTGDLRADLIGVVEAYAGVVERRGRMVIPFLAELMRRPELRELTEGPLILIRGVSGLVASYQARGRLRKSDPVEAAVALLAPVLIRSVASRVLPLTLPPLDPARHVDAFLEGWGAAS